MQSGQGRFSAFIRPLHYLLDLGVIFLLAKPLFSSSSMHLIFCTYILFTWLITTLAIKFYEVYRFTPLLRILYVLGKQAVLFALLVFAFFGIIKHEETSTVEILRYIAWSFAFIAFAKIGIFNLLKKYRILLGKNNRRVIILGRNNKTLRLQKFFEGSPVYGYKLVKLFDFNKRDTHLEDIFKYVLKSKIDEIYCSVAELKNDQLTDMINFADNNLIVIKFLPDNKEIFTKKLEYQYYGITPIISLRSVPVDIPANKFLKRMMDIVISVLAIIFLLSWFVPLIAILIKLESKGPVFFKQKRNGLDYREFDCYKFRSMRPNKEAHLQLMSKNDDRVTKVGSFLRRTSLDELPQFINVLLGDMSVVGPRPQMVSINRVYAASVDKFMVRHLVKPGITGLAQISGYRGEVETENDIKNRVRFDIFYLENWSLLMDLRIIAKTIVQIIKGDSKAY